MTVLPIDTARALEDSILRRARIAAGLPADISDADARRIADLLRGDQ